MTRVRGSRWIRTAGMGVSLLTIFAVAGCATDELRPSATVTTLQPAWPNWFRVEYTVTPKGDGTRQVTGYVHNSYGAAAYDVELLTAALDKSGAIVGQRLSTVPGGVPPMAKSYFDVRGMPAAEQYRVTVWSFTFQQSPSRIP